VKYGKVNPRFRKYFKHLHDRKAGPHDPKNAKTQELAKMKEPPIQKVRIIAEGEYYGERGVIVNERFSLGQPRILEHGVVFDWDVSGIPRYFERNELEFE